MLKLRSGACMTFGIGHCFWWALPVECDGPSYARSRLNK